MDREEIQEFYYITPLNNIPSIVQFGILSHERAKKITHKPFGWTEIQDRRSKIILPSGRKLHEYVNLYFSARNPTLCKKQNQRNTLCILRIDPIVLDKPDVIITDQNASSSYCLFKPSPQGLANVNKDWTFAEDWTDPDQITYWRKKSAKCAEVLVPDVVESQLILGAYVSCEDSLLEFDKLDVGINAVINGHQFFQ